MISLIRHLWKENREEIIAKSLLDCHLTNLHSIMLLDCPGKTIRMYIAEPGNELYKNAHPDTASYSPSLAIHPHHCNLKLHCIHGYMENINFQRLTRGRGILMDAFRFNSKISGGDGSFERIGQQLLQVTGADPLQPDFSKSLFAADLHTVVTPKDEWAAWLVFEGREDKEYEPLAYSMVDLSAFDSDGLYVKPTFSQIENLLHAIIPSL